MGKHDRGERKGQFCANPAETPCDDCSESKNYIEVCKPRSWFTHTFERRVRTATAYTFDKKYEAHHIACVAPVNEVLYGDKDLIGAVEQTKWCINKKSNMMAMPLWGHTVKWYCAITEDGGEIDDDRTAPKFKNIPQHDYDHNCKEGYTWEVEQAMKELAAEIENADHALGRHARGLAAGPEGTARPEVVPPVLDGIGREGIVQGVSGAQLRRGGGQVDQAHLRGDCGRLNRWTTSFWSGATNRWLAAVR